MDTEKEKLQEYHDLVKQLYRRFHESEKLGEYVHMYNPLIKSDARHDELYRAPEKHRDVSMRARRVNGLGDANYGLRIRVDDLSNARKTITEILQAEGVEDTVCIENVVESEVKADEIHLAIPDAVAIIDSLNNSSY